jgi:hypothetical protein
MFDLNPFQNPDAAWQQALMVFVSLVLGYIIGFVYENDKARVLRMRLRKLDKDLDACQSQKENEAKPEEQ